MVLPLPLTNKTTRMDNLEEKAGNAVRILLQTLRRSLEDTDREMKEYEERHADYEMCRSGAYQALVAGYFGVQDAIERINNELNK